MANENISLEFRLKEIDKTINRFIEKIKQNDLISKNGLQDFKLHWVLTDSSFYSF